MRIGDLALRTGVSTDAIRYYEKEGLLPAPKRTDNGYRDYGPEAVEDPRGNDRTNSPLSLITHSVLERHPPSRRHS